MKKIFLVLLALGSISEARLAGNWTGFGNWKFKGEGDGVYCSPMQMQWSESKTKIAIEKGFFDCELVAMHLYRTEWTIKEGLLFDAENKEVGTYDGNKLTVYMPSGTKNVDIIIRVKRAANHYDYQEIWYNPSEKIYVIEGRLFTSGEAQ